MSRRCRPFGQKRRGGAGPPFPCRGSDRLRNAFETVLRHVWDLRGHLRTFWAPTKNWKDRVLWQAQETLLPGVDIVRVRGLGSTRLPPENRFLEFCGYLAGHYNRRKTRQRL